jgi:hypothetical protein
VTSSDSKAMLFRCDMPSLTRQRWEPHCTSRMARTSAVRRFPGPDLTIRRRPTTTVDLRVSVTENTRQVSLQVHRVPA